MTIQPSPDDVRNAALATAAKHLLDMIDVQERERTETPRRETVDDANSRDERDQVFADAVERLRAALASQPAASVAVGEDINHQQFNEGFPWPDPTPEMLASPEFEAIWQTIKSWDINVPERYSGYMGATGNHVRAILDSLTRTPPQAEPSERELIVAWLMAKAAPHPGEPSQALIYALAHDIQNGAHLPADTAAEGGGE